MVTKCTNCKSELLRDLEDCVLCLDCGHSIGEKLTIDQLAAKMEKAKRRIAHGQEIRIAQEQKRRKIYSHFQILVI